MPWAYSSVTQRTFPTKSQFESLSVCPYLIWDSTNITVWLTSMAIQVNKLKKLNQLLDEEYQITLILASLPREYSSVVEQVKIHRRTGSTLITMDEIKKRLKERYLQLKRENGWSEDEMALNVKSGNNQNKNIKKGSNGKYFKGRCNHCGKFGHKKDDC